MSDEVELAAPDRRPETAEDWDRLFLAMGPAALLVAIEARMSSALRRRMTAEDVLQDAWMHAWSGREHLEWRGFRAFRSWFLTIADHRIVDLAEHESAQKRGGARGPLLSSEMENPATDGGDGLERSAPPPSTTPSRLVGYREEATRMQRALEALPDDVRGVLQLRLFEERSTEETARELGIGISAVKHRLRKGAGLYRAAWRQLFGDLPTTGFAARS